MTSFLRQRLSWPGAPLSARPTSSFGPRMQGAHGDCQDLRLSNLNSASPSPLEVETFQNYKPQRRFFAKLRALGSSDFVARNLQIFIVRNGYTSVFSLTHTHTYIPTYLPTFLPRYLRTYIQTYIRTYVHAYIHAYIHTYVHTYIRTYIL